MNRNIVLYIAVSLDGFIAKCNGSVDWLVGHVQTENVDNGYDSFYSSIDTLVIGRTTYDQIKNELSPDKWVYAGKKCFVASSSKYEEDSNVEFISENIIKIINELKEESGKEIWLVGGGKLIDQFIKENLIDKYVITIIPTILGEGIPLFFSNNPEIKLRLIETKVVDGMVELVYVRKEEIGWKTK